MPEQRFVFVLRVWAESEARGTRLRGSLQLVASDEVRYFSSLDHVTELLKEFTGWSDTPVKPTPDQAEHG